MAKNLEIRTAAAVGSAVADIRFNSREFAEALHQEGPIVTAKMVATLIDLCGIIYANYSFGPMHDSPMVQLCYQISRLHGQAAVEVDKPSPI
jgi:hypothetical protein